MADHTSDHADQHGHSEHGHSEHGHSDPHDGEHHGGVGKYIAVFVVLCILTAISFLAGSSQTLMATPAVGWTIMMAVSCAKALLVMLFFMHLIWEANWKYVLTIPASIMSVFMLLMLIPDVQMRTRRYSEERWLHSATPKDSADENGHTEEDHPADAGH